MMDAKKMVKRLMELYEKYYTNGLSEEEYDEMIKIAKTVSRW